MLLLYVLLLVETPLSASLTTLSLSKSEMIDVEPKLDESSSLECDDEDEEDDEGLKEDERARMDLAALANEHVMSLGVAAAATLEVATVCE